MVANLSNLWEILVKTNLLQYRFKLVANLDFWEILGKTNLLPNIRIQVVANLFDLLEILVKTTLIYSIITICLGQRTSQDKSVLKIDLIYKCH